MHFEEGHDRLVLIGELPMNTLMVSLSRPPLPEFSYCTPRATLFFISLSVFDELWCASICDH